MKIAYINPPSTLVTHGCRKTFRSGLSVGGLRCCDGLVVVVVVVVVVVAGVVGGSLGVAGVVGVCGGVPVCRVLLWSGWLAVRRWLLRRGAGGA
jgi:hypothetical protein